MRDRSRVSLYSAALASFNGVVSSADSAIANLIQNTGGQGPLTAALFNAKAALVHGHSQADITGLVAALAGKSGFSQGTLAARPAFGTLGRFYYATDTDVVSYDTGTAWVIIREGATEITTLAGTAGYSSTSTARRRYGVVVVTVDAARNVGAGTGAANVPMIAQLPVGWRPVATMYMAGMDSATGNMVMAYINTNGNISPVFGRTEAASSLLTSVTFHV